MALNRYRDWLRQQRTMSIEDLANRLFPDAAGDSEAIDQLTANQKNYEHLRRLQESMDAIFEAFADDTSPPHQTIVFGFNRPLQWDPNRIVQVQSHKALTALSSQLCDELGEAFLLNSKCSQDLRRRFEERLRRPVAWEHVRAARSANTELDMYFQKKDIHGKVKEITQWSLSVQRRIVKRLLAVRRVATRNKD